MTRFLTVVIAAVLLLPSAARADDYGPHREIRALRHDAPIILHGVQVDDVVVDGNDAVVRWHTGAEQQIGSFQHIYDRWWYIASMAQPLRKQLSDLASAHIPTFDHWLALRAGGPLGTPAQPVVALTDTSSSLSTSLDQYQLGVRFPSTDAQSPSTFAFTGRRPSENESWTYRSLHGYGNAYFFFSMTLASPRTLHVQAGTTIDVAFPFALDSGYHYSLTIANADPIIGPIDGTVKDNALHFVLPAFAAAPGADLMGEIDGDPPG